MTQEDEVKGIVTFKNLIEKAEEYKHDLVMTHSDDERIVKEFKSKLWEQGVTAQEVDVDMFVSTLRQQHERELEEVRRGERERILNSLPRQFWEDYDHAVGGYISKKDLQKALTPPELLSDKN